MSTNQEQIETAARAMAEKNGYRYNGLSVADKKWYADTSIAVLDAIHPTVTTETELDALPVGTLGVDADGDGFYVGFYGTCIVDYDPCVAPSPNLPATVLHIPGGAA